MEELNAEELVNAYLEALRSRVVDRCLDFFSEDGIIRMPSKSYRGKQEIEQWHRKRFDANLRVLRVEKIELQDKKTIVDGVISSDKLRAWDIRSVGGKATIVFDQGKIKDMKFALRISNPFKKTA
jgi:hypothetical protein